MSRVKGKIFVLISLICFLYSYQCTSQNTFGLQLENNKKFTTIPFELYNNLIVVQVKYNGFVNLNFILDTGVRSAILTDVRMALLLNPKYVRQIKIGGLGGGPEIDAFIAAGLNFSMPGISGRDQLLVILSEDVFSLSKYIGKEVHGILGYEIFSRFVVEIDYKHKVLKLYEPSKYKFNGKGEVFPLSIEDTKPFVKAEVRVKDNKVAPVKLIIDTGAGHALSLYKGTHPNIQIPDTVIRTLLGRGLSGDINGSMGRIRAFKLGIFEFENMITSFPDSASIGESFRSNERHGNLGADILNRFKVTFNYQGNYMILVKQRKKYDEFRFNMSGIDLISKGDELKNFIVDQIRSNSPAEKAGLMIGDEILSINGRDHIFYNLSNINSLFQSKAGRKLKLKIKRGEETLRKELVLEKII